jgi:hypothetical protein
MGHKKQSYPRSNDCPKRRECFRGSVIPERSNEDVLMKQYQTLVDTYKTYLDLTLKFVLFSYAVTGGIVSYCLVQAQHNRIIKFGLSCFRS